MKRICWICNKNKVGLFAWWYGLRHCEKCDLLPAETKREILMENQRKCKT